MFSGKACLWSYLGHHEISNHNGDNHGVILVDGIDASKVSVCECYGRETSWWLYVIAIDVNIPDSMEMPLSRLTRQPSIEKFTRNGVDYNSNLLGRFVFLFFLRLSFMSLLVMPLSPSIFCFVPSSIGIVVSVLVLLMSSGLAPTRWLSGLFTNWARYPAYMSSSILFFRDQKSDILWP